MGFLDPCDNKKKTNMLNNNFANLVSILKVGSFARLAYVNVRRNFGNMQVLLIMYKQGIIFSFEIKGSFIKVWLKYRDNHPVIKNIKLISKSSKRVFLGKNNKSFVKLNSNFSEFYIFSTTMGLKSSSDFYKIKGWLSCEVLIKISV